MTGTELGYFILCVDQQITDYIKQITWNQFLLRVTVLNLLKYRLRVLWHPKYRLNGNAKWFREHNVSYACNGKSQRREVDTVKSIYFSYALGCSVQHNARPNSVNALLPPTSISQFFLRTVSLPFPALRRTELYAIWSQTGACKSVSESYKP